MDSLRGGSRSIVLGVMVAAALIRLDSIEAEWRLERVEVRDDEYREGRRGWRKRGRRFGGRGGQRGSIRESVLLGEVESTES